MATTQLTKDNFADIIKAADVALVDFWASWCGPCQRFGPIFEDASTRHEQVTFGKLDTEAEQELASVLQIQAIPTLMAFKQGQLVFRHAGLLSGAQLDDLISQVEAFDPNAQEQDQGEQEGSDGNN